MLSLSQSEPDQGLVSSSSYPIVGILNYAPLENSWLSWYLEHTSVTGCSVRWDLHEIVYAMPYRSKTNT